MQVNLEELELSCFKIAQNNTPFDTGNLAFQALKHFKKQDGFTLSYRATIADYVYFLNERQGNVHYKFIETKVIPALVLNINSKGNGYYDAINQSLENRYIERKKEALDRALRSIRRSVDKTESEIANFYGVNSGEEE